MQIRADTSFYGCANTDADECLYSQLDESTPTVTAVEVYSATQIKFPGTGFPVGYNGKGIFRGIESLEQINFSQTSFIAKFPYGVPLTTADYTSAPVSLRFNQIGSTAYQIAYQSDTELENLFSLTDSTSDLLCSFFGGCSYTITAPSLTSMLYSNSTNQIMACG